MLLQKTIKKEISTTGIGLHSGKNIKMTLLPLKEDEGIIFHRSDVNVQIKLEPNNLDYNNNIGLSTNLIKNGKKIMLIEHLLSAIYSLGIDNLMIIINSEEIPIFDGSSLPYIMLLKEAGIKNLNKPKKIYKLKKEIVLKEKEKYIKLIPNNNIEFDVTINFDHPVIGKSNYKFLFSTQNYIEEISRARTFGFLKEVQYLRSIGLILGGNIDNAIILDNNNILNDSLRYNNEFVRHKILDAIGDMSILSFSFNSLLLYKYIAYKPGHKLNGKLVKFLYNNFEEYFELINFSNYLEKEKNKMKRNVPFLERVFS